MCGIVGIWNSRRQIDEAVLSSMTDALAHRGPDDSGIYIDRQNHLGFGHRRLSILDLSPLGHQPMSNDDGSIWITYNGEVYNFHEIRDELIKKGYSFKSNTDTEVIIKSYEEWGINSVNKFIGMFAIGIWDRGQKKLYLIRDRAGVKPLYYYHKDDMLLFGSELKALMKHPGFVKDVDLNTLPLYLNYGYIPAPYTIFKNTYKLKPGHYLCFTHNKREEIKYWDIVDSYLKEPINKSEGEILEELEELMVSGFKYRMVSDVPVGVFLSGGIDSSTLTALLASQTGSRLKTFTIGFNEDEYNEAIWAKQVANHFGTEHTEHYLSAKEALSIIPKLPEIYDEPFSDNSAIPTYLISVLTRNNVKVALSADGGDELFCGYTRYRDIAKLHSLILNSPDMITDVLIRGLDSINPPAVDYLYRTFKFALPRIENTKDKYNKLRHVFKNIKKGDYAGMYNAVVSIWMSHELTDVLQFQNDPPYRSNLEHTFRMLEGESILNQMRATDFKNYLPDDILTKVDRATMSVSLEGREPFLDHRLSEYAARIPASLLHKNGESKYLLKQILYKHIPARIMKRPKKGFSIPLHKWFKKDFSALLHNYLSIDRLKNGNIFKPDGVDSLVKNYMKGSSININKLWSILMFEMWREKWLGNENIS